MANKKDKAKIKKIKSDLGSVAEIVKTNKLEFADKLYKKLKIDYLDNDEMKCLLDMLSDGSELSERQKRLDLEAKIKDYIKPDGQVEFKKARALYDEIFG